MSMLLYLHIYIYILICTIAFGTTATDGIVQTSPTLRRTRRAHTKQTRRSLRKGRTTNLSRCRRKRRTTNLSSRRRMQKVMRDRFDALEAGWTVSFHDDQPLSRSSVVKLVESKLRRLFWLQIQCDLSHVYPWMLRPPSVEIVAALMRMDRAQLGCRAEPRSVMRRAVLWKREGTKHVYWFLVE